MRKINFIIGVLILLLQISCTNELQYDSFETSENGMPRYLSKIDKIEYSSSGSTLTENKTELFFNPGYNINGQLETVYNNIIGREANYIYTYYMDKIIVHSTSRNNVVRESLYLLENGIITSCEDTSNDRDEIYYYNYTYDSSNHLSEIKVKQGDFDFSIFINWYDENIVSVKGIYNSGLQTIYSFEYNKIKNYIPSIPSFWTTCYLIGGTYGVDEILVCQHYFGISVSKDLISEEYFNGSLSREFEYSLDSSGYVSEVIDLDSSSNKTYRKYILSWN